MRRYIQLSFALNQAQIEKLNEIAKELKKSRTELVREALDMLIGDFVKRRRVKRDEMDKN